MFSNFHGLLLYFKVNTKTVAKRTRPLDEGRHSSVQRQEEQRLGAGAWCSLARHDVIRAGTSFKEEGIPAISLSFLDCIRSACLHTSGATVVAAAGDRFAERGWCRRLCLWFRDAGGVDALCSALVW